MTWGTSPSIYIGIHVCVCVPRLNLRLFCTVHRRVSLERSKGFIAFDNVTRSAFVLVQQSWSTTTTVRAIGSSSLVPANWMPGIVFTRLEAERNMYAPGYLLCQHRRRRRRHAPVSRGRRPWRGRLLWLVQRCVLGVLMVGSMSCVCIRLCCSSSINTGSWPRHHLSLIIIDGY